MNFVCFCVCDFFFSNTNSLCKDICYCWACFFSSFIPGTLLMYYREWKCAWRNSSMFIHLQLIQVRNTFERMQLPLWVPDFKGCWMCDVDTRHCQWAQQICAPELPLCISLLLCTPVAAARQAWDRKKALHLHCSPSCPWKPYFHPEPCLFHNLVNEYHWKHSNFCAQSLFS